MNSLVYRKEYVTDPKEAIQKTNPKYMNYIGTPATSFHTTGRYCQKFKFADCWKNCISRIPCNSKWNYSIIRILLIIIPIDASSPT